MEKSHITNCPFTYSFFYFLYELVTDSVHFSVYFRFIVFVAFVMDCYSYRRCCCCFFFMRRRSISSDVLALEEKNAFVPSFLVL